jgi:hypothetical protein
MESAIATQEPAPAIATRSRSRSRVEPRDSMMDPATQPVATIATIVMDTAPVQGHSHTVFLETVKPFISTLGDPSQGSLDLKDLRVRLRAIRSREAGASLFVAQMVKERSELMDDLERKIEQRISELETSRTPIEEPTGRGKGGDNSDGSDGSGRGGIAKGEIAKEREKENTEENLDVGEEGVEEGN